MGQRELEFSGVKAQHGGGADEPFISEIGTEGRRPRRQDWPACPRPRDDDKDRRHVFSETWFSTILSYRHQLNTLRQAVKFIEKRKQERQRVPAPGSAHSTVRPTRVEFVFTE
ncbi:hypothetical protein [Rhizobium mongolense]|uniref:hypothetical protein n=1 Tax=Rhizobium mongolense TaxID=57676 RepID=UPI0003B4A435|nr:hypothetical protein [Rhizobium mongolense]